MSSSALNPAMRGAPSSSTDSRLAAARSDATSCATRRKMRRPLPVEQSLAARIARALDAAGADPREVAYLWSFLSSVSGDDSRNDGTVLARAGFGIVARGRRPFDQQKAELLSLLPDDLQATLLNAAPECGDGTAPRLHQENARVSGASEEPHETGGAGFARLVVRPECNGGMIGINVGLLREGIVYEIVEMMGELVLREVGPSPLGLPDEVARQRFGFCNGHRLDQLCQDNGPRLMLTVAESERARERCLARAPRDG